MSRNKTSKFKNESRKNNYKTPLIEKMGWVNDRGELHTVSVIIDSILVIVVFRIMGLI